MKYLFLDFGYVICYPTTGDWFITPYIAGCEGLIGSAGIGDVDT